MKTVLMATWLAVGATRALAGSTTDITIKPGPAVMSEDEKAIVADASKDVQHGLILIEETERNDNAGDVSEISFHLRAKIFSPEARALADIAIPVERGTADLKTWWGRTILPDGRVQELPESELKAQFISKSSAGQRQELRAALPGVVPGCVIDYGYVVQTLAIYSFTRVFLQDVWPIRSMRYRWVPNHNFPAAYVLSRSEGLPINVKNDARSVLVTASDLAPVPEEPHMPPLDEARASATFYYADSGEKPQQYWDHEARLVEQKFRSFVSGDAIKEAVASLPVPAGASVQERVRAAYAWIGENMKNTLLASAEEAETGRTELKEAYTAADVLKSKQGSPRQLNELFAGMARAIGADARIALAVDRSDRFWNPSLKSMDQFSYTLVAVHGPGEPDDKFVFVDAGSGLPYGEVRWRATGVTAMVCGAKGSASVVIPPAPPKANRADTQVTLAFSEGNDTMLAKWERTQSGAGGVDHRRWLRNLDTRERKETLDRLCGASGTVEVTSADLPGLEDGSKPFRIACEAEDSNTGIDAGTGSYSLYVIGAWWPETPEFTATTRAQPVLFDYPKIDITGVDVTAPRGFKPKSAPPPVKLESPYGRYELYVTATPTGYHVDRAFALGSLVAKPDEYGSLRKFFDDVRNADRTRVQFEKKREP